MDKIVFALNASLLLINILITVVLYNCYTNLSMRESRIEKDFRVIDSKLNALKSQSDHIDMAIDKILSSAVVSDSLKPKEDKKKNAKMNQGVLREYLYYYD